MIIKMHCTATSTVILTRKEVLLRTPKMEYIYRPTDKRRLKDIFEKTVKLAECFDF